MENKDQIKGTATNNDSENIYAVPDVVHSENAVAMSDETTFTDEIESSIHLEKSESNLGRVEEIRELRGANSKVFRMSDGSEQAVFYSENVHVFNEETQSFDEIDNTFTEENDGLHYRNGKNRFIARFSKDKNSDELFSVEKGVHGITVHTMKTKTRKVMNTAPVLQKLRTNESQMAKDALVFKDTLPSVELEYSVGGAGVKENIVIKEAAEEYRYPFVLECHNVNAELVEAERLIRFCSTETGEEVFNIPAPFMTDANGESSTEVFYEISPQEDGKYLLTVIAGSEWVNAENRAFPVVIDPQINVSAATAMTTYSWTGGTISSSSQHTVGTNSSGNNRMYVKLNMPTLPRNPRIKKAELKFLQVSGVSECGSCPKMGLYQVTEAISTGKCTPAHSSDLLDYAKMKTGQLENGAIISYTFDVTTLIDRICKGETTSQNLVLKMLDESGKCCSNVKLYGSTNTSNTPTLCITYDSSYAVNTNPTHTHELGRFGQGSIDLQCGNLMFDCEDFAWGGNRMPVTLKRLYNSALAGYQYTANSSIKLNAANFSAMKLGFGWKLNLMQSMVASTFQHEGSTYSGYVYVDENGSETYFKLSNKTCCQNKQCYNLYESVDGGLLYDPYTRELKTGSTTYLFDTDGRLTRITDEYNNHMDITYSSGRIASVTDGASRKFDFTYNSSGYLTSVTAPDNTKVQYTYSGDTLASVTYPDGRKVEITSSSNKPTQILLKDSAGNSLYKVAYSYSGDRVTKVAEYGVESGSFVAGVSSSYSYSAASGSTTVETTELKDTAEGETNDNIFKTVYTFDDDGSLVGKYAYSKDTGNVGAIGDEGGLNLYTVDNDTGIVSNINNLLTGHRFETLDAWYNMAGNSKELSIKIDENETYAHFGKKMLRMQSSDSACKENGVYQTTESLPAGQYTFSAYLRIFTAFSGGSKPGAYLRVTDTSGKVLTQSERISAYDSEYIRLAAPFELTAAKSVRVQILLDGAGTVYVDAAQLENNPYVNAYNALENGNFERDTKGWTTVGASSSTAASFNMSRSLTMTGDVDAMRYAYQDVNVKANRSTRETFILSGWAKGYGIVNKERDGVPDPQFRLRAVVHYYDSTYNDYSSETFTADFSSCTEDWQFASVEFSKSKYRTINCIKVYCDYSYNSGTVYFDDIQLVRTNLETGLVANYFVTERAGNNDDGIIVQDTAPAFNETKDSYGNALTETSFIDGEFGTIYRSFGFDNNGNNLIQETDARGNGKSYTVDENTSRNKVVSDKLGNMTAYEYDAVGRTTKVTSKDTNSKEIAQVSYAYDGYDRLTEITRGDGMKYSLKYNAFHNLDSIGVEGISNSLIKFTYKNGNGRLKEITYANGHTMKAIYNSIGQMTSEKWYASSTAATLIAHYKYVYDGQGNIVRSIDILQKKEYTYTYDNGRIVRSTECDITLSNEIVTEKILINSISYTYDNDGKLTKKRIISADGSEQVIYYENPENENAVVKFNVGGKTITSHSKTDSFGRKVFDELQLGTGFVSRQFSYYAGQTTKEHRENGKLKSSPTTQLVSQIVLSDGRTISYEYDKEERITRVIDSVDGTTEYTYDALGQLLTEKKNGITVNTTVYDNYGNITKKNGVAYTYGNSTWKDLLTKVGNQTISYDDQGNPTSYLGHTLTWEKGRQLKSFDNNSYTYNANGIRTSKTVNGVKHTYILDGNKILKETWGNNTLIPLYDNEDSVCGIIFNNEPFCFLKNLQGDIIAITDKDGKVIAKYSYDAWGVCTVVQDISEVGIAKINPIRYRGYYFDQEIEMYYLQKRYYNPSVCRFINADTAETLTYPVDSESTNLFSYCHNNPINETDCTGLFLASKLAEIFLSAVFGMVAQLFDDLVIYFAKVLLHGKQNVVFNPNPSDYISRALEWALECVNPFSGKKKILNVILAVVPVVVKTIWDFVAGRGFDLMSFLGSILSKVLSTIIDKVMGIKSKKEIAKIKDAFKGRKPAFKAEKLAITVKNKVLGQKITTAINIGSTVLDKALEVICNK